MPRIDRSALALALLLTAALIALPSLAQDLTLDQVLEKYYEAVGGKDAWAAVGATHQKGTMQMMGMEAPIEMWAKRPHKLRIEFTMQGMTGIQAVDGENGWQVMPFMGSTEPEPMPDEMREMMSSDVEIDGPLMNWKEKGHQVELVGEEDVEGTPAYHLQVTLASGLEMDYFLDAEHFVPIRLKGKASFQGQELETTTTISDYKEVDGLMIPHSLQSEMPMGSQSITLEEVEINPEIEDSFFAMPAPAAPAEGEAEDPPAN